jgi:hypothetical protein
MMLVVFLLACYGTTNILTGGKLFEGVRAWLGRRSRFLGYWSRCPMCMGVPVGIAWAFTGLWPALPCARVTSLVAAGAASSAMCWVLRVILHRLGEDEL